MLIVFGKRRCKCIPKKGNEGRVCDKSLSRKVFHAIIQELYPRLQRCKRVKSENGLRWVVQISVSFHKLVEGLLPKSKTKGDECKESQLNNVSF